MQVFIVGSPLETAKALDPKRLNRQIQETKVILAALNGAKAWSNHPCVLQYRGREEWLRAYKECLEWYVRGDEAKALWASNLADYWRPLFHTEEYFSNMKARLYTKKSATLRTVCGVWNERLQSILCGWRVAKVC